MPAELLIRVGVVIVIRVLLRSILGIVFGVALLGWRRCRREIHRCGTRPLSSARTTGLCLGSLLPQVVEFHEIGRFLVREMLFAYAIEILAVLS